MAWARRGTLRSGAVPAPRRVFALVRFVGRRPAFRGGALVVGV